MSRRALLRVTAIPLTVACALALSACGSSSSDDKSSGSSVGSDAQGLKDYLKPFLTKTSDIGIDVPLTGKPPTNKVAYFINPQAPAAVAQVTGFTAASQALGWTVRPLYWSGNSADSLPLIAQAIQAKADFIAINGLPDQLIGDSVSKAKAAGIPVFLLSTPTVPKGKENWAFSQVNNLDRYTTAGRIAAASVAQRSTDANILMVDIPSYTVQATQTTGFKDGLAKDCPACKFAELGLSIGDATTPGKPTEVIINYLRAHPDVNYVVFGSAGQTSGFYDAAASAGLATKVKYASINTVKALSLPALLKGQEQFSVAEGLPYLGWLLADAMARYTLDMDLTPNWKTVIPELVQTKDNVANADDEFTGPTGYEDSFKKLWKLS